MTPALHHARGLAASLALAFAVALPMLPVAPALAQLRVVNYNIAQLIGNQSSLLDVLIAMHADDKPGFAVPVGVIVCQEVLSLQPDDILALLNASAPPGVTYAQGTFTSNNEDDFSGAQAMFYRTDLLSEIPSAHVDIYTGAGRRTDRWKLQLVGYTAPASAFYIYSSHLKSSEGAANVQERLEGAQSIRLNADALGPNQHLIYAGDYNVYNNAEPAYLHFLSAGNGQAFDPLGAGSWSGSGNAIKHTQSPRLANIGGLVGGGLDDRFDFQLSTAAFADSAGLARMNVPFAYRSFGNDGNHYNLDINTGNNTYYPTQIPRSNALAFDLHEASDHIAVLADYQIPAKMAGVMPAAFGRVIQGAAHLISVTVTNPAPVITVLGGDILDFTATGSLALSGVQSGAVDPLGDFAVLDFALNTAAVGNVTARVTLNAQSQAAQPASLVLNSTGSVLRHANASFESGTDINATTIDAEFDANTGAHILSVPVHNFGFDALQALLDVDSVSSLGSPFAFAGGLAGNIGATPATLEFAFDSDDLKPGVYETTATISVSDENIPGESDDAINLTLSITILGGGKPCAPDVTGDALVNIDDLLAVISAWGACPAPPVACPADVNADDLVNIDDLLAVISAWGACP